MTNPNLNSQLQNFIISNNTQVLPAYGSKNPAGLVPRRATTSEDPNVTQSWLDGTLPTQTSYRYKGTNGSF